METTSPKANHLQPGMLLCDGRYVIEKKIGAGGFGITYRAMQSGLNRAVCIKEFFPSGRCMRDTAHHTVYAQDIDEALFEKYRQAFRHEAETLAALQHPSIVEVIDIFDENNTSYMVMPFVEGRTLQQMVDQQGPLSYPEAVNYIAQVADAVGYIHQRHILHRDIKPDNIIITAEYRAILIDFGSAREFVNDKTQAHTSILTHGYAPTEQYSTTSRKGSYTDIYALGATLYFVLSGKVPMDAAARMSEEMPEPRSINPAIPDEANRTIMKAMQMKAVDRHQTVQEFMDDLRNVHPSQTTSATASSTSVPSQQTTADNPVSSGGNNKQSMTGLYVVLGFITIAIIVILCLTLGNRSSTDNSYIEEIESPAEEPIPEVIENDATSEVSADNVYDLDSRKLTDDELRYMTSYELRLLRNEIFARHGYIFNSSDLQKHFGSQSWYRPVTNNAYDLNLNSIEQYNINLIKQYE